MQTIVLATGNKGKLGELSYFFTKIGLEVKAQSDFDVPNAQETGTTFVENAIIKARHAAKITGLPAIADDSGLEIDALNGAPGVYSARYAGISSSYAEKMQLLLAQMKGVPDDNRTARMHCVLVFMRHADDPSPIICHGVWQGRILTKPQGTSGFGYDPIFFAYDHNCGAAELTLEQKQQTSHRAQALKKLFNKLSAHFVIN